MAKNNRQIYDVIVIGSGMGGMTSAALLSKKGYRVLVLEAASVPGGCSSSFYRKGFIFESGATTLMGFDENQPMRMLEKETGIIIPRKVINPAMVVYQNGNKIIRYNDREIWIEHVSKIFRKADAQRKFWNLCFRISDKVWKAAAVSRTFPPNNLKDIVTLIKKNDWRDTGLLRYAFKSARDVARGFGLKDEVFTSFLDEQLIISTQSKAVDTPFLVGALGLTYTNYTNYYIPGGMIEMVKIIQKGIEESGSEVRMRQRVAKVQKDPDGLFSVVTSNDEVYRAKKVIANIPVWNLPKLTSNKIRDYFEKESQKFSEAWGAFTMGIVTDDSYPDDMPLHHQIILPENQKIPEIGATSVFISFSMQGDTKRAKDGYRVLNISAHTNPEIWFSMQEKYDEMRASVEEAIISILKEKLPGFADSNIQQYYSATPVSWQNWIYRFNGRVGGIPQNMKRLPWDWTPNKSKWDGFYLCGDTVFPGQGIPGVTLSGFNVYYKITNQE